MTALHLTAEELFELTNRRRPAAQARVGVPLSPPARRHTLRRGQHWSVEHRVMP